MSSATATPAPGRPAATTAAGQAAGMTSLARHLPLVVQLALAALVVRLYAVEGDTFFHVFLLAAGGAVVNLTLPLGWRLPFFGLLSLAGSVVVFGPGGAAWLIGAGLVLIGICHLPLSLKVRGLSLLVVGALLALARGGILPSAVPVLVWPILGSMFMFRLVLYLLSGKNGRPEGGLWGAIAYFFMLPNLAFPLFPVIDYQTFRRTFYDKDQSAIYEQGMVWIGRGIVHLLLYRLIYQRVLNDPDDVVRLGDLVRYMLGTLFLYLRVSGQFHLIVGILHLFGFRLPETHKLYYLASSFTELWRRINIYWTDFMMKVVFYPTYFKVKQMGPARSLVVSTSAVFVTTWVLHSYQWFWLRGGFPLTPQDFLFWAVLGAMVVYGALRELNAPKKIRPKVTGWNRTQALHAARTFAIFCFLWSLWSAESVTQWLWMLGAAARVDAAGILLLIVVLGTIVALGGRTWDGAGAPTAGRFAVSPSVRTTVTLAALLVIGQPSVEQGSPALVASTLDAMKQTGLNERDAALQHRGYYEQLDVRAQLNAQVLDVVGGHANWQDLSEVGVLKETNDVLTRELLPSRHVVWNGHQFSTNSWGMRDQEYSREKAPGTLRIALLGPSHVMGNNVGDGELFESLVEARLNRELHVDGYDRFEVLNFGVDGFSVSQQVALFEQRALSFSPDVVILTHYRRNRVVTERYLAKMLERTSSIDDPVIEGLCREAGLIPSDFKGGLPIPYAGARRLARAMGLQARMPDGEASSRIRSVSERLTQASLRRFAEVTAARGVRPLVLVLDAVTDDAPSPAPNAELLRALHLPVSNLLDVFPAESRASLRVAPWDDHPNAEGHRLVANRLYADLTGFLTRGGEPSRNVAAATDQRR